MLSEWVADKRWWLAKFKVMKIWNPIGAEERVKNVINREG